MKRAMAELKIEGVRTTAPLHRAVLEDEDFLEGRYTTGLPRKAGIQEKVIRNCDLT
jgi:acetyl-CoA carboxylase biotin carboxylase subunit